MRVPRWLCRRIGCSALSIAGTGCVAHTPRADDDLTVNALGTFTRANQPPGEASEEATDEQLALARDQGRTASEALDYLLQHEATTSATARAGEYELAVALIAPDRGSQAARSNSTVHLAVVVRDGYDGRLVPNLTVHAKLFGAGDKTTWEGSLSPVCDPVLDHYGAELDVTQSSAVDAQVLIEMPRFYRHDPINGDRYHGATAAMFHGLQVELPLRAVAADPARRLELARRQGASQRRALGTMLSGVAVDGQITQVADYWVACAVEYAEGFWYEKRGQLAYDTGAEESAEHNAHVEVAVADAVTGRLLTDIAVSATLLLGEHSLGTRQQALMWHPWLYHYGRNWRVPRSSNYRLRVELGPTRCVQRFGNPRQQNTQPIFVEFNPVRIKAGEK